MEPASILCPHTEPVHHQSDIVVDPAIQPRRAREVIHLPVHTRTHESLSARAIEEILELAFSPANERSHDFDLAPDGPCEHEIGDLGRALSRDR